MTTGKASIQDIEGLINKIISVINSRVVSNKDDQIIEIHILASNQRSAKQIIRDVQSALMSQFNLKVDHKIISIAQVYEESENFLSPRLMIKSVEYTSLDITGRAKVILEYDEHQFIGEAEGVHSSSQAHRLVAQATLNAVELFVQHNKRFIIEEIKVIPIANRSVVISGISLVHNNSEKMLIGKCIVENDINSAITKSVLDAINRMIEVA
ncbi:MAG: hypothetical protein HGA49_01280 [Eubacteriaceae bacterium]|nr:hypothetical protein [Eubacteriaceae bacterium]